ncbi:hypothetical protein JW964_19325 [candidate division KSB1 bacterium]|nr:hypothetical protein [candidate division KSB1 bacterium]
MKAKSDIFKPALSIILLGPLFTIFIGFIFKGTSIFTSTDPGFQFVVYGIAGSLLLAIIHLSTIRNFVFGILFILMAEILIFKIANIPIALIRLLYLLSLSIAIYIYYRYYHKTMQKLVFGKFIPLAALVFIANLLLATVVVILKRIPNPHELAVGQAFYGFLIGTGIGIGFELSGPVLNILKNKN